MQTLSQLQSSFGIQDHVHFHEDAPGMVYARISTAASDATVYLQGAHLTQWTQRGGSPVLYLSQKTEIVPGKAIRGGVPVLFPWFGDRWNAAAFDEAHGTKSPKHGTARVTVWQVDRVHLLPTGEVEMVLSLGPDERTRSFGFDSFRVTMELRIGAELHQTLTVLNQAAGPLEFEEGLHPYFAVDDVHATRLLGLRGSTYLDKRDQGIRKVQRETEFAWTRDVDQIHVSTAEPLTLRDGTRTVHMTKVGSDTTVIWNPWEADTAAMADMPADGWRHFVCVEPANAGDNRISLAPGASHGMSMRLAVE